MYAAFDKFCMHLLQQTTFMYYCICFCNKFSINLSWTIHFNDSFTYDHSWTLCTSFHEVFISWTIYFNDKFIHDHSWSSIGVCISFQDVFTSWIICLDYTFITVYIRPLHGVCVFSSFWIFEIIFSLNDREWTISANLFNQRHVSVFQCSPVWLYIQTCHRWIPLWLVSQGKA